MYRTIYLTTFEEWIEEIPDSPELNTPAQWFPHRYAYTTWDGQWYELGKFMRPYHSGVMIPKWTPIPADRVPRPIRTRALLLI